MSCEQLHAFVRVDTKVPSEFASGQSLVAVSHSRWGGYIEKWS